MTLSFTYKVDNTYLYNAEELISLYLTDIPLRGINGQYISESTILKKIKESQTKIENALNIKIPKQLQYDEVDFRQDDFRNWGFVSTNYPINKIIQYRGAYGWAATIEFPVSWLSIKRNLVDKMRNIYIVPGQQADSTDMFKSAQGFWAYFTSLFLAYMGGKSLAEIPNFWNVKYLTGWDKVPDDIESAVGKTASTQVLLVLGDVLKRIGVTSESLSQDGQSQSTNYTQSSTAPLFAGRIKQYNEDLKEEMKELKGKYNGISISVC